MLILVELGCISPGQGVVLIGRLLARVAPFRNPLLALHRGWSEPCEFSRFFAGYDKGGVRSGGPYVSKAPETPPLVSRWVGTGELGEGELVCDRPGDDPEALWRPARFSGLIPQLPGDDGEGRPRPADNEKRPGLPLSGETGPDGRVSWPG